MSQRPLRCLITGANTGLGFEVAKQLLLNGHEVILACRDTQKAQQAAQQLQSLQQQQQRQQQQQQEEQSASTLPAEAVTRVTSVQCDLSSFASVRRCAADVAKRWPQLDLLICNAAVIPNKVTTTDDGIEQQIQVNHLSHFLLVDLLLPCVVQAANARFAAAAAAAAAAGEDPRQQQQQQQQQGPASSRVVVVGSGHHARVPPEFEDPGKLKQVMSGGAALPPMQMYGVTKLCNVWFTRYLANHVLSATQGKVVANVVTPGFIPNTGLSRHMADNWLKYLVMRYIMPWAPFATTLKEGGRRVVAVCLGDKEGRSSGLIYSKYQIIQPSAAAQDDVRAAECWRISCEATGVSQDTYGGLKVLD